MSIKTVRDHTCRSFITTKTTSTAHIAPRPRRALNCQSWWFIIAWICQNREGRTGVCTGNRQRLVDELVIVLASCQRFKHHYMPSARTPPKLSLSNFNTTKRRLSLLLSKTITSYPLFRHPIIILALRRPHKTSDYDKLPTDLLYLFTDDWYSTNAWYSRLQTMPIGNLDRTLAYSYISGKTRIPHFWSSDISGMQIFSDFSHCILIPTDNILSKTIIIHCFNKQ